MSNRHDSDRILGGRTAIAAHPDQIARLSLVQGLDGAEAGGRFLDGRVASGLAFRIALDRGGDLVEMTYRGQMLGWIGPGHQPTATAPGADGEDGLGLLRSFSGFIVTCGHDYFGPPRTGPAVHLGYTLRSRVHYPLHGRAAFLPAMVEARRIDLSAGRVEIDLRMRQASLFGTVFDIRRRLEFGIDRPELHLSDEILNAGLAPSPVMTLYHINLGHPLIADGTTISGLPADPAMPSPLLPLTGPAVERFRFLPRDQVAGTIAVTAPSGPCLRIGLDCAAFTHVGQWWNRYPGMNCVGIEPATAPMPPVADEPWEPTDWLPPGGTRRRQLVLRLEGDAA